MVDPSRLLVVGGGPRAIGILERLVANTELLGDAAFAVDIVDPYTPGSGRIWRHDQNGQVLMNSLAEDVSTFTDDSVECAGPAWNGPTLAEWAQMIGTGEIELPEHAADVYEEAAALSPTGFASRKLNSQYLEWFYRETLQRAPANLTVHTHTGEVTALVPAADGATLSAELDTGEVLTAERVVLALGHTDTRPTGRSAEMVDFAERHGLYYAAPAQTQDVDFSPVADGRHVIVSGFGLAFVDLMSIVTEGRGGRFTAAPTPDEPDRVDYHPSGAEPVLHVGSRRGVPYHPKISSRLQGVDDPQLQFLTPAAMERLPESVNFLRDILPLITADIEYAVYREILTGHPEWAGMDWDTFSTEFFAAARAKRSRESLIARAIPEHLRVDLDWLDRPLAGRAFGSPDEVERAVAGYIRGDLDARTSPERSDTMALFTAILRIHFEMSASLPVERLDAESQRVFSRDWQSFFNLMESGPPPHRMEQLLALQRAGLVKFIGPSLQVRADEQTGLFLARSAQVADSRLTADAYIDSFLPNQQVDGSANHLLASLIEPDGLGREEVIVTPKGPLGTGALEVSRDHRLVAPDGRVQERIWAVGPATSEVPLGAFARPNTNAAPFRRNDEIARAVLTLDQ